MKRELEYAKKRLADYENDGALIPRISSELKLGQQVLDVFKDVGEEDALAREDHEQLKRDIER